MHQSRKNNCKYSITHWFQPIYHLKTNKILGHEALLRDAATPQISPVDIFRDAEKNNFLASLDLISIKSAWNSFEIKSGFIFINIFPSTLFEVDFLSWWDKHIPPTTYVVLELLENEPIRNWGGLKAIIKELQARNVKIAIDDMGAGYSFFQQWVELDADFIKLDRYFSKNLSTCQRKQKVVKSLIDLFSETTEIIIEGVEQKEDLAVIKELGIPYAQGYLLGKPHPINEIFIPPINYFHNKDSDLLCNLSARN